MAMVPIFHTGSHSPLITHQKTVSAHVKLVAPMILSNLNKFRLETFSIAGIQHLSDPWNKQKS